MDITTWLTESCSAYHTFWKINLGFYKLILDSELPDGKKIKSTLYYFLFFLQHSGNIQRSKTWASWLHSEGFSTWDCVRLHTVEDGLLNEIDNKSTPSFPKFVLHFYERPTSVCVFVNWQKSKEEFFFYKRRRKMQTAFGICFAVSLLEMQHSPWTARVAPFKLLTRELHLASQHQTATALNCVCEHLCFILIYFVHLLARCVLRYQKSLERLFFGVWECSQFFFPCKSMVICFFTLCHLSS